jgi:alkylation response protein AidB-like acyl-CoA dehydrogenase
MARDYALERKVFSRPIGSFQAIKHKLADILCLVEVARSNAWFAAWSLTNDPAGAPAAAAAARLSAIEAYEYASRENVQVHGGIGYTWEADCHFYYRRSRLLSSSLGTVAEWSDRLVDGIAASALAA